MGVRQDKAPAGTSTHLMKHYGYKDYDFNVHLWHAGRGSQRHAIRCNRQTVVTTALLQLLKAMVYSKRTLFYYSTCIEHRELKLSEFINLPHSIAVIFLEFFCGVFPRCGGHLGLTFLCQIYLYLPFLDDPNVMCSYSTHPIWKPPSSLKDAVLFY